MAGFGLHRRQITPAIVREVAADFCLELPAPPPAADVDTFDKPRMEFKFVEHSSDNLSRSAAKPVANIVAQPWEKSK
jgi:hypothetical protein